VCSNRITGVPYAYDVSGNMTNDGSNALVYDAENRVVSATNGSSSGTYTYDGNGLRVKKVSGGTTTVTVYSGGRRIAEYVNGALPTSPTNEYMYSGNQIIMAVQSGNTYYFHHDHLSLRVRTNSTGAVADQRGHYPFGETWYSPSGASLIFTTYYRDIESGNDYAMARYDTSRLGRFTSPDPLPGALVEPQSLNRYLYTANDPVNKIDPSGLITLPCYPNCGGDDEDADNGFGSIPCWLLPELCGALTGQHSPQVPDDPFGGRVPGRQGAGALAKAVANNQQPPPPSNCWIFAESLADKLWNGYMGIDPNRPGLIDKIGSQMMTDAQANVPFAGGRWKTLPIDGFKPELVSNNQRGDVYRHILFFAGGELRGAVEWNYAAMFYDWYQKTIPPRRNESETELRDDFAGIAVGTAMRLTARAGGNGDYQQLFRDIAHTLCD
jgi:RHS repeat-associated protein